jgi:hypothetical protein
MLSTLLPLVLLLQGSIAQDAHAGHDHGGADGSKGWEWVGSFDLHEVSFSFFLLLHFFISSHHFSFLLFFFLILLCASLLFFQFVQFHFAHLFPLFFSFCFFFFNSVGC